MIDFDKLEAEREAVAFEKADLFDFYHANWRSLFDYAKELAEYKHDRQQHDHELMDGRGTDR